MVNKDYILKTNRLHLRAWRDDDIDALFKMNSDAKVMRYFPKTLNFDESLNLYQRLKSHHEEHGFTFFATEEVESKQLIGFVGLARPNFSSFFTPCVEIGWRLHHRYWNNGYASEAATACLNYAFNNLDLTEVYSFTTIDNYPSQRVMQKIGMKQNAFFNHPNIDATSAFSKHVLYKIEKSKDDNV